MKLLATPIMISAPHDLSSDKNTKNRQTALRYGWTTGCCATAAVCAAWQGLQAGQAVSITLPAGQTPTFIVAFAQNTDAGYCCGIIKDAGDDPDVTDGVLVKAAIRHNNNRGVRFFAGDGVGRVTRAGLPLAVGEPAINPKPRQMLVDNLRVLANNQTLNLDVTISIPGGEELAVQTWNPRLGIVGGLSILGTTGIVRPYSCSAWIHSIYRGIDVARANDWPLVLASTGSSSESAAQDILGVGTENSIEMGDFAGATFKYLRQHPVPQFVLAGGFAKLCKLAQGAHSLHSKDSQIDMAALADMATEHQRDTRIIKSIRHAPTGMAAVQICPDLARHVAQRIIEIQQPTLPQTQLRVMIFDRGQQLLADSHA